MRVAIARHRCFAGSQGAPSSSLTERVCKASGEGEILTQKVQCVMASPLQQGFPAELPASWCVDAPLQQAAMVLHIT